MRRLFTLVVIALLFIACGGDGEGGASALRPTNTGGGRALPASSRDGVATFYDADGSGNCSFDESPDDLDVVALAMPEYNGSATCGACLQVTGPKGDVTVRVTDSCPGCEGAGVSLDLSAQAFAKIAEPEDGRVKVRYRLVSCATSGPIAYHFKDGSSKYWTAIQIRNHRVPIERVEYRRDGAWIAMKRADYNYFIEPSGVGDQPSGLSLRVTGADGQLLEDTLSGAMPSDEAVRGARQFE